MAENLEDLWNKAKPIHEQAIIDEGLSPDQANLYRATLRQEGGFGKTSNRGAIGIGQITPDTFKRYADKGWDIKNEYQNARTAARILKDQYEKSNGNHELAATGYYSGDGGRIKAAKNIAVHDPINKNAPNSIEYGKQVASKVQGELSDLWDQAKPIVNSENLADSATNTVNTISKTIAENYPQFIQDKEEKILELEKKLKEFDPERLGMYGVDVINKSYAEMQKAKKELQRQITDLRGTTERAKQIEDMPNFMPRDIPLVGLGIEAFSHTALAKELRNKSKGIPYLDATAKLFATPAGELPSKFDIGAGQVMHKFGAGIADLLDTFKGMVGNDKSVQEAIESQNNRFLTEKENNKLLKEFNENPGLGGNIGGMLPYMLTGEYIGKPLIKATGKITNALSEVPSKAINETKGAFSKLIERKAADPNSIVNSLANKAKVEWTDPWAAKALHNSRVIPPWESYLKTHGGGLLGPAALGAVEGGLHYDNTMGEGALSSVLGQKIGERISPYLTRGKNYRTQVQNKLLKDAWLEGYNPTPGHELGNLSAQRFEAGVGNNEWGAQAMNAWNHANRVAMNRSVFTSLGIPRGTVDQLGPKEITALESGLKKQYNEIVGGITGQFDYTDRNLIRNHMAKLVKNTSDEGMNALKSASYYSRLIDEHMGIKRNALGQIQPSRINGEDFQTLRSDLKGEITNAWANKDRIKAKALQPLLNVLDNSVEKGIRKGVNNPEANIKAFKELNRKWATYETLVKNGLDDYGNFDPNKFRNFAMSKDTKRYMKESGGENMNNLFKWAKVEKLRGLNAGSDLGGMGVHASSMAPKRTLSAKLLMPFNTEITGLTNPALRAYLKGWPAKTGLLGMSGEGFGNPALYMRAYSENKEPWPGLYHKTIKAKDSITNEYDKQVKGLLKALEQYKKK